METFQIGAPFLGILLHLIIPAGILSDLNGPKIVLRAAVILCVFGVFLLAFSLQLWVAILGRWIIGAGDSFSFIGAVRMNTLWFSKKKIAFMAGISLLALK